MRRIPFNRPALVGKELEYIQQAVDAKHLSGDGLFGRKCSQLLETELRVRRALLTPSCTHALELAALILDIRPGDEIIVPAFTFVSTINAFVLRGARPVFVDVRRDTLNLDEALLESAVTERTRAIVPVHYAGVGCEMDDLLAVAGGKGLAVVEDNAHGLFGRYRGKFLGTFGSMATQSFHETKNFSCGEGGAILINDAALVERAEILREKGTDRSRFFRGEIDKYTWQDIGSSLLPSELQAAYLFAQFEKREEIQARREALWTRYAVELSDWAVRSGVRLPSVPEHCEHPFHLFYLVLPSLEARKAMIAHLDGFGIDAVFHYLPLHLSRMGRRFGGRVGDCPVSESLGDCLLRLPLHYHLSETDQSFIIEKVRAFGWPPA